MTYSSILSKITAKQIVAALAYGSGVNDNNAILNDKRELNRLDEIRFAEYPAFALLKTQCGDLNEIQGRLDVFNALIDLAEPPEKVRPKNPIYKPVLAMRSASDREKLKELLQSISPDKLSSTLAGIKQVALNHLPIAMKCACFNELTSMNHWEMTRNPSSTQLKFKAMGRMWMLLAILIVCPDV